MKITADQIELAATMMKILHLVQLPGMDEIAIKLNCGATYDELQRAKRWARAFELASEGGNAFELAKRLRDEW